MDIEIAARAEFLRDEVLSASAHPFLDIIAGDDEVFSVLGDAAHHEMDVRMLSVPVIDGDPLEFRAEILFHLAHEIAGEGFEIGEFRGVLRRDDEAEMMPVIFAPLGDRLWDRRRRSRGQTGGPFLRPGWTPSRRR